MGISEKEVFLGYVIILQKYKGSVEKISGAALATIGFMLYDYV
jgi:hypothetical protein